MKYNIVLNSSSDKRGCSRPFGVFGVFRMTFNYFLCGRLAWLYHTEIPVV